MSQMNDGFTRGDAAYVGPQIEAMLLRGEPVMLQISGDSMRPTLKPRRDAAVIEPLTDWPPKRGDILYYRSPRSQSGYALHRVYKLQAGGPIMNGDAQEWVEGPIAREDVLAHATALFRGGKPLATEAAGYKAYVALWRLTRLVRKPVFAAWRAVKGIFG